MKEKFKTYILKMKKQEKDSQEIVKQNDFFFVGSKNYDRISVR